MGMREEEGGVREVEVDDEEDDDEVKLSAGLEGGGRGGS